MRVVLAALFFLELTGQIATLIFKIYMQ